MDSKEEFKLKLKTTKNYPGKFYFMVEKRQDRAYFILAEHAKENYYGNFIFQPYINN